MNILNTIKSGWVGVYVILNIETGRPYIGGTTNLDKRFEKQHVPLLKKNKHENQQLQLDWNKYGASAFVYLIIDETTIDVLKELERKYIKIAKEEINPYNIAEGAPGPIFVSDETRKKMSEAKKGCKHPNFGKPCYEGAGRKPKQYKFKSPSGEIVDTIGLKGISLEHGLTMSNLSKLANGKIKEYKGWTRVNELAENDFRC